MRRSPMKRRPRRKHRGCVPDNEALLESFRQPGRCAWCGRWFPRLEAAHVVGRGMGGWSRMDVAINLVSLCREDHQAHHDGQRPLRCDLLAIVAAREGMLQAQVEDELAALKWGK